MVGIDDADYAGLLPVPLTTLRQPARELGAAAHRGHARPRGRSRICRPATSCYTATLITRESCGANDAGDTPGEGMTSPDPSAPGHIGVCCKDT